MGREANVNVFQDTEKMVKTNQVLMDAVKYSNAHQVLIPESRDVSACMPEVSGFPDVLHAEEAQIVVSGKRTYEAASAYKGKKVCVHNFASASNPGGGVTKGASAQEESLCRCSTLYFNLNTPDMWAGFYSVHRAQRNPIHNDDCIYTPDVVVFKTDTAEPELMKETDWYKVNVITCAAPNLRLKPNNEMNPGDGRSPVKMSDSALYELHVRRGKRILDIAIAGGNEVVILGAFGCGAFQNNPEVVANAAKTVINDYKKSFHVIEFAVYCSPRDDRNYRVFKRILDSFIVQKR